MTNGEIIQRVQSLYSKGVQSDDTRLSSRHIFSVVSSVRSTLLKNQANKRQQLSQWSYQTLPCVELVSAPIHECSCIPHGGCVVLRTKYKLPKPISGMEGMLIQSITTLDSNIAFDADKFENHRYAIGNKYTSKKPRYYFRNQYLYITVLKLLKTLTITGLFDNPIDVSQFPSLCPCEDCDCINIMDMEFPIEGDLVRPLIQMASEELIALFKQMNEDKSNDSSDNTNIPGAMVHMPNQQEQQQ